MDPGRYLLKEGRKGKVRVGPGGCSSQTQNQRTGSSPLPCCSTSGKWGPRSGRVGPYIQPGEKFSIPSSQLEVWDALENSLIPHYPWKDFHSQLSRRDRLQNGVMLIFVDIS